MYTNWFIGYYFGQNSPVLQVPTYLYGNPFPGPIHRLLLVLGSNRNHVLLRQTVRWHLLGRCWVVADLYPLACVQRQNEALSPGPGVEQAIVSELDRGVESRKLGFCKLGKVIQKSCAATPWCVLSNYCVALLSAFTFNVDFSFIILT